MRQFSGIVYTNRVRRLVRCCSFFLTLAQETERPRYEQKLQKLTLKDLKDILEVLDLERMGTKVRLTRAICYAQLHRSLLLQDALVERALSFLEGPYATGNATPSKKRKRAGTSSKRKGKKQKVARPEHIKGAKGAYILFTMDIREKVKQDNPDLTNKELMSKCGEKWNEATDAEKEVGSLRGS